MILLDDNLFEMIFDQPTNLVDAITQYVNEFREGYDIKDINKLQHIKNLISKKLSSEQQQLVNDIYIPIQIGTLFEYYKYTKMSFKNSVSSYSSNDAYFNGRNGSGTGYSRKTYPYFAMRNYLIDKLSYNEIKILFDVIDNVMCYKKNKTIKYQQEKCPSIVMANGFGCPHGKKCTMCRQNTKGKKKQQFNKIKFAD